ncbi:hypothetical protein [Micromonospora sp. NPDC002575]|uniref:hypothetical protein n=1 Tax=Micromonospora sp. NPDC002575 TaxID=3364222 RepID=UPI003699E79A
MTNEGFAGWLGIAVRTVAYWHSRPDTVPGKLNQEILTAALNRVSEAARDDFLRSAVYAVGESDAASSAGTAVVDIVSDATESVAEDPLLTLGSAIDESIESLQEEMVLLAGSSGMTAFDVFTGARHLRNEARKLVERTRRPGDLADLYVIVGQGTALMASTAFDLGHWNESTALARASTQYADLAGDASLKAWTYGLRMTLANWRNEPDAALTYFARAMREAPKGEPRLRLRYIASRSHALLADAGSVARVLDAAQRDREVAASSPDGLSRLVGGEFAFGAARAAACAAAAWLDLGNGEQAAKYAHEALRLHETLPAPRQPYSQINGARIDVATAYLHMGERDAAADALHGVLELPAHKRNVSLTGRLAKAGRLLTKEPWASDPEAQRLAEGVSVWLAETSARPLS